MNNYLLRLEQFENAIKAYNEALRWNNNDVRSLLGRSMARAKATHYPGALEDVARASELEPNNMTAKEIQAQIEYERCAFERALLLALRGQLERKYPHHFGECARHAEETVRECAGRSAAKVLQSAIPLLKNSEIVRDSIILSDIPARQSRMQGKSSEIGETPKTGKHRADRISRLMASKYLDRMAHDKYFLMSLCKDERLQSANVNGSQQLQELAKCAFTDIERRQNVLRERRPLYAARASEAAARARLSRARKDRLNRALRQHIRDAQRLIHTVREVYEQRDTHNCLEHAEFAMEQITRKTSRLLPGKEKYLQDLYDIIANAFLFQKKVCANISEAEREKRALGLLGLAISREPSQDSVLRTRPRAPRDPRNRERTLIRALDQSTRPAERCYLLHELARLLIDLKQSYRGKFYASKCQTEARKSSLRVWHLNATFLLARCYVVQNNRPEARATLLEGSTLAHLYGYDDVAEFFETCAIIVTEGEAESEEAAIEKREKALVSLMLDEEMRSAAKHLFRRMSTIPAARRFSIMPGTRAEDMSPASGAGRRASIMPREVRLEKIKRYLPLGFQDFDI